MAAFRGGVRAVGAVGSVRIAGLVGNVYTRGCNLCRMLVVAVVAGVLTVVFLAGGHGLASAAASTGDDAAVSAVTGFEGSGGIPIGGGEWTLSSPTKSPSFYALARSQSAAGEIRTVQARLSFDPGRVSSGVDQLIMAGFSFEDGAGPDGLSLTGLALTWEGDYLSGWFPTWRLRLRARPGLLAPSVVDGEDALGGQASQFVELGEVRPDPRRTYESRLSLSPEEGVVYVRLVDLDAGATLLDAFFPLADAVVPTVAGGGARRVADDQDAAGWSVRIESVEASTELPRSGPPWRYVEGVDLQLGVVEGGEFRRRAGSDFRFDESPAAWLKWPGADETGRSVPGGDRLELVLVQGDREIVLAELPREQGELVHPLSPEQVPYGDSRLQVRYVGPHHAAVVKDRSLPSNETGKLSMP